MFLNLGQGSFIYGLDIKDDYKLFTGFVNSVSVPRSRYGNNLYHITTDTIVDVIATVNGDKKEFKQIPSNTSIADFGDDSFILADSKEALNNYIESLLQSSKKIVDSVDKHKTLIEKYNKVLDDLYPNNNKQDDKVVQELKEEVGNLKSQLKEAIELLKSKDIKN